MSIDSPVLGGYRPMDDHGLRVRMRNEERRVCSQHEKLDDLVQEIWLELDKDGPAKPKGDFLLFVSVLDAHMSVEEDVYFPALHGLRPDAGDELARLVDEHHALRESAERVTEAFRIGDRSSATRELDALARAVKAHEAAEEELIASINEGPLLDGGHCSL